MSTGQFVPTREQQTAIEHVHGPMLVVAGAGTGKTTVLAQRIARLIQSEAARPDEILAVTYTRNSAAELISRVAAILYPPANQQHSLYPEMDRQQAAKKLMRSGLQAHTFHSYCYRLLQDAGTKFQLARRQRSLRAPASPNCRPEASALHQGGDTRQISARPAEIFQQLSRRTAYP